MIQDTSFQAFSKVQPKINRRQQEVLQVIREHPEGLTDAEINHYLGWTINRVTPPRGDLMERKENDPKERIRLGLIYEAGVRICRKNHNPAKTYKARDITLPPAFEKPPDPQDSTHAQALF